MEKSSLQRAKDKYNAEKTKHYGFRVMLTTEKDIVDKLSSVDNLSGYIKDLIRKDIEREA